MPRLVHALLFDLRYSLRRLARTPSITAIAVLTLALGLAASTAIFTLTWAVVLKSLPVPRPHELVQYTLSNGVASPGVSYPLYTLLRERQRTSSGLLAFRDFPETPVRHGSGKSLETLELLTPNALAVLELHPALGQGLAGPETALISDAYARRIFGSPAAALGRSFSIARRSITVIGVLPPGFQGLTSNLPPAIYLPLAFAEILEPGTPLIQSGNIHYSVLGRLKPGATLAQALAEAHALEPNLRRDADPSGIHLGRFFRDFRLTVQPGNSGNSWLRTTYQTPLLALELLVALLLLLCAANTALVMLARVSGRRHEYALTLALGAPRLAIARQLCVESLLLAFPALALGLLLGWAGAHTLVSMLSGNWDPSTNPQALSTRPNAVIVAVNGGLTLLIALGTALVPARQAASQSPALDLKSAASTLSSRRAGSWAIALQTALSLAMVSAAFLVGNTLVQLLTAHSGFNLDNAATATVDLSPLDRTEPENRATLARLQAALAAQPGVEAAGFTSILPLSGHYIVTSAFVLDRQGRTRVQPTVYSPPVTLDFFAAAGTKLLSGKPTLSTVSYGKGPQSCALSQSLASTLFPGEDPLGRLVYFAASDKIAQITPDPKKACRIAAVVEDARYVSLREPAPPMIYSFYALDAPDGYTDSSGTELILRAHSEPLASAALHRALAQTIPPGALVRIQTFRERAAADLGRERILVSLSGLFALLALLLTGLGLYGLLMRSVAERQREIGIRLALGAPRASILAALGRPAFLAVAAGLAAGVPAALALSRFLAHLFPASTSNPHAGVGIAASAFAVVLIAALGTLAPARKAARTEPTEALRSE